MGIASMVIGIIAIIIAVFGSFWGWLGVILGVIGIVLGALGKKNNAQCATAGLVLSIIATSLALVFWLACAACVGALATASM